MADFEPEKKYDTVTARVFYRMRDLFIEKGSVYTAKGLKIGSVGVAALAALALVGFILYRLSEPMGKSRDRAKELLPKIAAAAKLRPEPPRAEPTRWPSNEEILQHFSPGGNARPIDGTRRMEPPRESSRVGPAEMGSAASAIGPPPPDRSRADEPLESSKVFERPRGEEKATQENPDYEYVSRIPSPNPSAPDPPRSASARSSPQRGGSPPEARSGKPSLFHEVRARLLTRIDTSLPKALVVAEVAREATLGGFQLRRGDVLLGTVSAAGPKRVAVTFNKLIDHERREHAITAEALDLAGATGLAAQPVDSKLKKGMLWANDRALDYVRAFSGRVSIVHNPAQSDLRHLENKAQIVEANTEFTVVFHKIEGGEARP